MILYILFHTRYFLLSPPYLPFTAKLALSLLFPDILLLIHHKRYGLLRYQFHPIPNYIFLLAFLHDSLYPFSLSSYTFLFATLFTFHSKTSFSSTLLWYPFTYSPQQVWSTPLSIPPFLIFNRVNVHSSEPRPKTPSLEHNHKTLIFRGHILKHSVTRILTSSGTRFPWNHPLGILCNALHSSIISTFTFYITW